MKLTFNLTRLTTIFLLLILTTWTSCKKERSNDSNAQEEYASQASSEADAESEIIYNEIFDNVMGVNNDVGMAGTGVFGRANITSDGSGTTARTQACPDVTITHLDPVNAFPVRIVLDFGTGCTGRDGHLRSGKIIVVYTNRLIIPDAKATTTFENFKFDEIKVEGTHIITNLSTPVSNTNPTLIHKWKVVVDGGKLTKPNGNYTEWNSIKYIIQLEGSLTPYIPLDDIYKIEGNANGKVKRGDLLIAWRTEITEPLIKKFSCRWIVKGVLKVTRLNLSTNSPWLAAINYGTGYCDNKAVVTINGISHEITLP